MTVSTLRPLTTVSNSGAVTGSGGDADLALRTTDDSTFITFDEGEQATFTLDDLTLPANALIKSVAVRLRTQRSGLAAAAFCDVLLQQSDAQGVRNLEGAEKATWVPFQTTTLLSANRFAWGLGLVPGGFDLEPDLVFTDSRVDALTLRMQNRSVAGPLNRDLIVAEAWVDVTYVEKPIIGVGRPLSPTTDTTSPPVIWLQALDEASPVSSHFEAKIFTDDQVAAGGFDPDETPTFFASGIQAASFTTAGAWDYDLTLPDGDYEAFARTAVTVNGERLWSDWESLAFTMDVDDPAHPLLFVEPQASSGRIKLTLAPVAGGAVTTDLFEVERSDDGETTWNDIRTVNGDGTITNTGAAIVTFDYEAPNGVEVVYRARSLHDYEPGYSASEWVEVLAGWASESWWFKHPTEPELNFEAGGELAEMMSHPGYSRAARQGVFQPIGRGDALVVTDKRGPRQGRMGVKLLSFVAKQHLDSLVEEESPVFVQAPAEHAEPDRWVVIGDSEKERFLDKGWFEPVQELLDWTEVARPSLPGGELIEVEEAPVEVEGVVDFDSFSAGATGTGTLAWTHTPVNDGEIIGAVVGIISDAIGATQVDTPTVEGLELTPIADAFVPVTDGIAELYMIGTSLPDGPLDFSITVTGAAAKRACSWLLYGEGGDTTADDVLEAVVVNAATASGNLDTTADGDVIVGCAWESPNDVALVGPGADYTSDHEHDFGVNVGVWQHRTADPDEGTVSFDLVGADANTDYGIVAVAIRVGVAPPPGGGSGVLKEDLATLTDPTGGSNATSLWRKADSAYAPFSGDFNWSAADLQHTRLSADPDPHIPVGGGGASTHYRRTTLSEVYLNGALSGSPTSVAVTTDPDFPVPPSGICSIAGVRAFTYSGRTGTGSPNYTLTGVTWIDATPTAFASGERVGIQSTYDAGVPNDSYRVQLQRWSGIASNTFYLFEPGMRRQIVLSCQFDTDHLPWDDNGAPNTNSRSMVWQFKPSPSGGIGPIFSMVQFGHNDTLEVRHDTTGAGSDPIVGPFDFDPSVGWIRLMMDITFQPSAAAGGRFQLFGDLDGDKLNYEDMVPLSEQLALKSCGSPTDSYGQVAGFGIGPYCRMLVPAHYREYANIQVIDPAA